MSQYKNGDISVTNGSSAVVGDSTAWSTNVNAGDLLTVVNSGVTYQIASVTDDTHLTLSVNYAGTTASGLSYVIARDFTPNLNLPYIQKGDLETATILAAQAKQLDSFFNVNKVDLTTQAANVAATTIIGATTQAGLYRVSVYVVVSQAGTSSSTLPDTRIIYTDRDSGAAITIPMTSNSTGNTTSTYESNVVTINVALGSNIQYDIGQVTAYASSGATPMQFAYHARLEFLG